MTKNNEEKIINSLFDCKKCKLKSEEECLIYERCYKANEYICNLNKNLSDKIDQLKAENEKLKEELSTIQHNCNREGCKYYDDNTFKVFYECKAQKALQLSANSVTTKYCDLLQILTEIKEFCIDHTQLIHDAYPYLNIILEKINEVENV